MKAVLYEERSQSSKSGRVTIAAFVCVLVGCMLYTTYKSVTAGGVYLSEYFIEIVSLLVLGKQAAGSYVYRLTDDSLLIEEKTLWRSKSWHVPYALIDGVYEYRREMSGPLKFRYKYRKAGATDPRKVRALAYAVPSGRDMKHGRVLIKAEDAFFEILDRFVPGRVLVPQEDVAYYALIRAEASKRGETPEAYMKASELK